MNVFTTDDVVIRDDILIQGMQLHLIRRIRILYIVKNAMHISLVAILLAAVTGVSVHTHYCGGTARYSAMALDAQHESCCGDGTLSCASCEDHVSSNVVDTQMTVTAQSDGLSDLYAAIASIPHEDAAARTDAVEPQLYPDALGPPGPPGGDAIPILIQSFLI